MPPKSPCPRKSLKPSSRHAVAILCATILSATTLSAQGQERGPSPVSPQDLRAAIDQPAPASSLGALPAVAYWYWM
jgi:hypothetical protein